MDLNNKNNGFDIPEDYFDVFEERLLQKLEKHKLPKSTGFILPKNYLENVESNIESKLKSTYKKTNIIPLFTKKTLYYALAIASCAILIITLTTKNTSIEDLNNIPISSLESYLEEEQIGITTYDIASLLNTEEIVLEENILIENEEIENYLLENLDNTLLILE